MNTTSDPGASENISDVAKVDWHSSYVSECTFVASEFPVWFPPQLNKKQRWMGTYPGSKRPFEPAGDRNPPHECTNADCPAERADEPECECDGRFKWGYSGHYVTGREIGLAVGTTEITHRSYIFSEDDPYLFVDLDDVRCPVTGEVHPVAIAFLVHLGPTWIEVSSSGTGLHAVYAGDLPGNMVEAKPVVDDEPWGANDEVPQIEFYDATSVGILTGMTVPGAPREVRECDSSALRSILDATNHLDDDDDSDTGSNALNGPTLNSRETGDVSHSITVTDDMEAVFTAINDLDARRVAEETIVREWIDPAGQSNRAFVPVWAPSGYDGTAVYCTGDRFTDSGKRDGYGGPVIMAAIDLGIISDRGAEPGDVTGRDFFRCVAHLYDLGFDVPHYVPDGDTTQLYLDVIKEHAPDGTDPFENPESCLVACLEARQKEVVPEEAEPPSLALVPIIEYVSGVEVSSTEVDDGVRALAHDVFDELTVEMAHERFGLDVLHDTAENGGVE